MTSETRVIMPRVMLALSRLGFTVFRHNVGTGWVGTGKPITIRKRQTVTLNLGDMVLRGPVRPLHAGLVEGGSDVIGWRSVVITPEMVGRTVAVFSGVEAKSETGTVKPKQAKFMGQLRAAGGIVGVARSEDDAVSIAREPVGIQSGKGSS